MNDINNLIIKRVSTKEMQGVIFRIHNILHKKEKISEKKNLNKQISVTHLAKKRFYRRRQIHLHYYNQIHSWLQPLHLSWRYVWRFAESATFTVHNSSSLPPHPCSGADTHY